mmetsp:Transcript_3950/g.6079  ORF Transcript_3950/g.6079 Transcript_3950/m.6079 type:complete len:81 (-) Transcript_3950:397-639(-)
MTSFNITQLHQTGTYYNFAAGAEGCMSVVSCSKVQPPISHHRKTGYSRETRHSSPMCEEENGPRRRFAYILYSSAQKTNN